MLLQQSGGQRVFAVTFGEWTLLFFVQQWAHLFNYQRITGLRINLSDEAFYPGTACGHFLQVAQFLAFVWYVYNSNHILPVKFPDVSFKCLVMQPADTVCKICP